MQGLNKFTNEVYKGKVVFFGDLTPEEQTVLHLFEATYGHSKIIVAYEEDWKFGENGERIPTGLEENGYCLYHGDWYAGEDVLETIQEQIPEYKGIQWTEAGMQDDMFLTFTFNKQGWF